MKLRVLFILVATALILAGCGGNRVSKPGGGFYGGDSAPDESRDYDSIPDAVPGYEPLSATGNKPYKALGKNYVPLKTAAGFTQEGVASWYGKKFHGRRTSSGETYDMWEMTAAHPILPLPSYVEVTNLDTGKRIVVKVNDRGPFLHNRIIDLSYAAAHKLGIAQKGTGRVRIAAIETRPADTTASNSPPVYSGTAGSPGQASYYLQVGAYDVADNALEMRNRLRHFGQMVYPESDHEQLAAGRPYRVRVGPFTTFQNAEDARRGVEQLLGQPVSLIIR